MTRAVAYLLRRTIAGIFTVLLMVTLTFAIFWATPTQPANFVYQHPDHLTQQEIVQANHLLGTDRSKLHQYLEDVPRLFVGDLGRMWSGTELTGQQTLVQQPIAPVLLPALGVTLSLVHGVCPDAMVMVVRPDRTGHNNWVDCPIAPIGTQIAIYEQVLAPLHPGKVVAVAVNTHGMSVEDAASAVRALSAQTHLPTADPVRQGCAELLSAVRRHVGV